MPEKECTLSNVTYNKCDTSYDYQKSMRYKDIVILSNQKRIVTDSYGEESPIVKESVLSWYNDLSSP